MKTIAIMQPTYLSWCGYFAMIDKVDEFVILDSVQFARRSWQQRNRIKGPSGELMLTLPVTVRGRRDQLIRDVELVDPGYHLARQLRTIEQCYRKAPFFDDHFEELAGVYTMKWRYLADLTTTLLRLVGGWLNVTTRMISSSALPVYGHKDELMLAICRERGADVYIAATGSREYMSQSRCFAQSEIAVEYMSYQAATYKQQFKGFLPRLSALDVVFNMGPDSRDVVMRGRRHDDTATQTTDSECQNQCQSESAGLLPSRNVITDPRQGEAVGSVRCGQHVG